jgi:release factor glutamine methyltransferase
LRGRAKGTCAGVRIVALPGVFSPLSDTRLLARHVRDDPLLPGGDVLDLCSGTGALAVVAALGKARSVTAVDVSRRAALSARLNARVNGVRVRARRGDLFAPVAGETFDLIVSNPPYLPAPEERRPRGRARGWDGGRDGRSVLDRICAEAPARLRPGGALLLVHSSVCGERATLERLARAGLEPTVVERCRGPLGPLLSSRARLLETNGALAPGEREEELLVMRAVS